MSRTNTLALFLLLGTLAGTPPAIAGSVHFGLERSEPEAHAVLEEAPSSITLWFTERPELGGARIRLVGPDGELVKTGEVVRGETERSLVTTVEPTLEAGDYGVHWRAMARDGHVVSGEFEFVVRSTR